MRLPSSWENLPLATDESPSSRHTVAKLTEHSNGQYFSLFLHFHPRPPQDGEFQPLWLGSDVVEEVSDAALRQFDAAGDATEAAWLKVGDRNILVGNSAIGYGSSFAADKVRIAAYQVGRALGRVIK